MRRGNLKQLVATMKITKKKISSSVESFRDKKSQWSNLRYYIPLCTRPVVPVTIEMLEKVEPLEIEKVTIKEAKNKLYQELSTYLGYDIPQYSPHLYHGLMLRNGVYLGTCLLFSSHIIDFEFFAISIPVAFLLLPYSCYVVDNAELHKRFMYLTTKE